MYAPGNKRRYTSQVGIAWIGVIVSFSAYSADEIAAFRLTGVEGHVEMRYIDNEQTTRSGSILLSKEIRTSTEEEIYILTHSYIYHPKFLKMDIGVGPLFVQKRLDTSAGGIEQDDSPFNVDARLRFLEEKPYPLTLYYNLKNQVHGYSLDRYESKYTRQGFNFNLRKPVTPIVLSFDGSREKSKGTGFDYRYDDTIDLFSFRSTIPTGENGNHQLTYINREVSSETGRLSSPIQKTVLTAESMALDSRVLFGDQRRLQLTNNMSYQTQENSRSLKEIRFNPNLHWQHSDELRSYYRFNYLDSEQEQVTTLNRSAAAGFTHQRREGLGFSAELHSNKNDTTGLVLTSYGTSASVNYSHKLAFGRLGLSAGARYDAYDRVVTTNTQIKGASYSLTGTAPVQLQHDHIVLATIRVFQVFAGGAEQELIVGIGTVCRTGIDILVTAIGVKTEILNCNGIAGEDIQVKVDYKYDPGGTVAYTTFSHNYQLNLDVFRYYKAYARFSDSSNTIRSGVPTLPLDEVRSTLFGAQVDYPLYDSITMGAEVTQEEQTGTFTSFDRNTANIYAQFAIWSGSLILSQYRVKQDYVDLTQDTDLVRYRVHFRVRPWNSVHISLELNDEEDTGGSAPRRSRARNLAGEWRIRQLTVKGEAQFAQDIYGSTDRDHSQILVTLRRDF